VLPASFQSRRALEILNVPAVGFALAAATAAVAGVLAPHSGAPAVASAAPTLLLGTLWALLLRWPKTVGKSSFRWGWVASLPLAALNSALAAGLLLACDHPTPHLDNFVFGAFLGTTVGAVIWIPALILTLLCFGVPIAWSQKLAKKGLAGQERGEWIVGLACTLMSIAAVAVTHMHAQADHWAERGGLGYLMTNVLAALGVLTGGSAAALAIAREARRRRFVADAEAGKIAGYRVDATDEGKVLVRVVSQGTGYRVADFEEEIFELDAEGEATKPKHLAIT
jgi:hypothetical protein